jgi:hypothetical protein
MSKSISLGPGHVVIHFCDVRYNATCAVVFLSRSESMHVFFLHVYICIAIGDPVSKRVVTSEVVLGSH